jgi:hypothetical protein
MVMILGAMAQVIGLTALPSCAVSSKGVVAGSSSLLGNRLALAVSVEVAASRTSDLCRGPRRGRRSAGTTVVKAVVTEPRRLAEKSLGEITKGDFPILDQVRAHMS